LCSSYSKEAVPVPGQYGVILNTRDGHLDTVQLHSDVHALPALLGKHEFRPQIPHDRVRKALRILFGSGASQSWIQNENARAGLAFWEPSGEDLFTELPCETPYNGLDAIFCGDRVTPPVAPRVSKSVPIEAVADG
jgi:hypothetical protein